MFVYYIGDEGIDYTDCQLPFFDHLFCTMVCDFFRIVDPVDDTSFFASDGAVCIYIDDFVFGEGPSAFVNVDDERWHSNLSSVNKIVWLREGIFYT
ncbi:hypothetical protein RBTH_07292 [Bacillus thuringiensis serovar israelensis ATCC 35646]|nr:hypothetical protein RBTH_07292 [Bacillus thuringiensis serovar israelensis ATCC 35646]